MRQWVKNVVKWWIARLVRLFPSKKATIIKGANYIIREANKVGVKRKVFLEKTEGIQVKEFCVMLAAYDVVSFDVFGTLIVRAFPDPKVIFDLWGEAFSLQYGRKLRAEAERDARAMHPDREVRLEDIYDLLTVRSGIPKAEGMKKEIELELCYCRPNLFLREVFQELLRMGKEVIILSDMYLPREVIATMLERCGYTGYSELFVSSEIGRTKASGDIYDVVAAKYGKEKSYIQVGDNQTSDIKNAKSHGWNAYYYENVDKRGKPYRPGGMSSFGGGLYRGIVNAFLYASPQPEIDPYYKLGYVHFGLFVYGYCSWLNRLAITEGAELILFASRDMDIVQKVYRMCFDDIASEYIAVSRLAIIRADFKKSSEMFLTCLRDAYHETQGLTIGAYFSSIQFDFIFPLLDSYGLTADDTLDDSVYLSLRQMIFDHKEYFLKELEADHTAARNYYSEIITRHHRPGKILFADMNGRCTSMLGVQHILLDAGFETKVLGAQAYSISNKGYVEIKLTEGSLETYLFSYLKNRNVHERFKGQGIPRMRAIEAIFTEARESLRSYASLEAEEASAAISGEYAEQLRAIHQGIADFAQMYHSYAQKMSPSFWVSPYDAFIPMEQVIDKIPSMFPDLLHDTRLGS